MARFFCRNTNGLIKKRKTIIQTWPLVVYAVITIFCVSGFCVYVRTNICSFSYSEYKRQMVLALKANEDYLQQNSNRNKIWKLVDTTRTSITGTRRLLGRPGSSPPRCTSKCGRCVPCKPVQVTVPPVPPGTPVTTEYYPEAWRCKCGNKLYMP